MPVQRVRVARIPGHPALTSGWRSRRKYHVALQYLQRALQLERAGSGTDSPAGTHLNICAILSHLKRCACAAVRKASCPTACSCRLNLRSVAVVRACSRSPRHREALSHAQCALELLQEEVAAAAGAPHDALSPDRRSLLAIAFYNRAVEYEHLKQHQDALESYGQAVEAAARELGPDHPMTAGMRASYQAARGHAAPSSPRAAAPSSPRAPAALSPRARGSPRRG